MIKIHIDLEREIKNCAHCPLFSRVPMSTTSYCKATDMSIPKDYEWEHSDDEDVPDWCSFVVKDSSEKVFVVSSSPKVTIITSNKPIPGYEHWHGGDVQLG